MKGICLSGGAAGADLQWGMCAGMAGHSVFHYTFSGHKSTAPKEEQIVLDDEQLKLAAPLMVKAAVSLNKHPPKKFPAWNLISRNYYQIKDTERVYAVTSIVDGIPTGGTAWAIMMFLLREGSTKECYVYDQNQLCWFKYDNSVWLKIETPPEPHGLWAGIGTRDLTLAGKNAIRALMGYQG